MRLERLLHDDVFWKKKKNILIMHSTIHALSEIWIMVRNGGSPATLSFENMVGMGVGFYIALRVYSCEGAMWPFRWHWDVWEVGVVFIEFMQRKCLFIISKPVPTIPKWFRAWPPAATSGHIEYVAHAPPHGNWPLVYFDMRSMRKLKCLGF